MLPWCGKYSQKKKKKNTYKLVKHYTKRLIVRNFESINTFLHLLTYQTRLLKIFVWG